MEHNSRFRSQSILVRLLIAFLVVLLLQMAINLLILQRGGVVKKAEENAFSIFGGQTDSRRIYLQNEMVRRWSATGVAEVELYQLIGTQLQSQGIDAKGLLLDREACTQLIEKSAESILMLLRSSGATGAFLMLDSPDSREQYPGIFIRDFDPANDSSDFGDLLLERGQPAIARAHGVAMNRFWKAQFDFSDGQEENAQFCFRPLDTAKHAKYSDRKSEYYQYWSWLYFSESRVPKSITYSIPLIWEDGTVMGVLGVEVTDKHLASMLKYEELCEGRLGAYFLGVSRDGGQTYEQICASGPDYSDYFAQGESLTLKEGPYPEIAVLELDGMEEHTIYGAVKPIDLYNTNTPFEGEQWALIGILDDSHLLSFSRNLHGLLIFSVLASLLVGLVMVFFAVKSLTRPISRLGESLRHSDPDRPIRLEPTRITEIDTLTSALEEFSDAAAKSAMRISKIISLAEVPIGVFEHQKKSNRVFCSRKLFQILRWPEVGEGDGYLSYVEFTSRMKPIKSRVYDREAQIYYMEDEKGNPCAWVKISYGQESGGTILGAVQDVTRDIREKQKIEYERDFDVLTGLFNRRAFDSRLSELFLLPAQEELKTAALLMFDLDNLKYVNDTYGHECGDRYLQSFADNMRYLPAKHCLAGRRSGDEFNVFLYGYESKEEIQHVVAEFWHRVERVRVTLPDGTQIPMGASGGLAWYPDDATEYKELLRRADTAMYGMKRTTKGGVREFGQRS